MSIPKLLLAAWIALSASAWPGLGPAQQPLQPDEAGPMPTGIPGYFDPGSRTFHPLEMRAKTFQFGGVGTRIDFKLTQRIFTMNCRVFVYVGQIDPIDGRINPSRTPEGIPVPFDSKDPVSVVRQEYGYSEDEFVEVEVSCSGKTADGHTKFGGDISKPQPAAESLEVFLTVTM